ncbi:hypothetical protein [Janthinobacterium aquaticum]|uniref:hypothetical protein n=1 Tax=Janthinobacterium sp. FT58W TaxID=2654254 RepID=UPI001264963D|nr:hypothetical protein [Janthinobacterium sp. FT58W]KAB8043464.1 hypothetical protein GCM43_09135 [Janthinobacterium sp. FT58W]
METLTFSEIDEVSGAGFAQTVSTAGTISGFAAIGFSLGGPIGGVAGAMLGAGICYGYFNM